jgi:hypothetical protein
LTHTKEALPTPSRAESIRRQFRSNVDYVIGPLKNFSHTASSLESLQVLADFNEAVKKIQVLVAKQSSALLPRELSCNTSLEEQADDTDQLDGADFQVCEACITHIMSISADYFSLQTTDGEI